MQALFKINGPRHGSVPPHKKKLSRKKRLIGTFWGGAVFSGVSWGPVVAGEPLRPPVGMAVARS